MVKEKRDEINLEDEVLNELRIILSDLYYKHGIADEVIQLSQIIDKLIVQKQIYYLNKNTTNLSTEIHYYYDTRKERFALERAQLSPIHQSIEIRPHSYTQSPPNSGQIRPQLAQRQQEELTQQQDSFAPKASARFRIDASRDLFSDSGEK